MKNIAEEKTTSRLEKILKNTFTKEDAERYIRENTKGAMVSFKEYFDNYIAENQLDLRDIKRDCGISGNYFYNVINADRKPGRDKVLALCVAAGMSYEETQKALRLAGAGALNVKNDRDAIVVIGINNHIKSVTALNIMLDEHNLEIIK